MNKFQMAIGLFAFLICHQASAEEFEQWLEKSRAQSLELMLQNVSPPSTLRGVVVASPSKDKPDYWYHWVRDAALVMNVIVEKYAASSGIEKAKFERMLLEYIELSRSNQVAQTPSASLGEPKFNVDGTAYTGPWGRPQNDGPALRAVTLTKLALLWLAEGKEKLVREKLYESELPALRVIKADLEYVSHRWPDKNFDLWEEISGDHFYTRMVQRRALLDGSRLADRLGDPKAAAWYRAQARHLEPQIAKHWDDKKRILIATLNRDAGVDYKWSGLDSAVVLGVLHGDTADGFFAPTDGQVLSTVHALEKAFIKIYPINQKAGAPGLALGRYPEDRYDGVEVATQGNPWFLITAGYSELYHSLANHLEACGAVTITSLNLDFYTDLGLAGLSVGQVFKTSEPQFVELLQKVRAKGDLFLQRVQYHGAEGRFAEQINRWTGFLQGASDLTWSYAAFLTATWERTRASDSRK